MHTRVCVDVCVYTMLQHGRCSLWQWQSLDIVGFAWRDVLNRQWQNVEVAGERAKPTRPVSWPAVGQLALGSSKGQAKGWTVPASLLRRERGR